MSRMRVSGPCPRGTNDAGSRLSDGPWVGVRTLPGFRRQRFPLLRQVWRGFRALHPRTRGAGSLRTFLRAGVSGRRFVRVSRAAHSGGFARGCVLFEVEKFFRFLVRVDSEAFNLATLLFVKTFINRVKPSYTFPLFVVRRSLADATFDITDSTAMNVTVRLYDGLCNSRGLGYMIDDPNPAGGGLMASVDSGSPIQPAPAYPVHGATYWGVDQEVICPQDYVVGRYTFVLAAPALPTLDSIYLMDSPLFTAVLFDQGVPRLIEFRPEGVQLGADLTAAGNFTLTDMQVRYEASYSQPTSMSLQFVVRVNNVDAAVVPVVLPSANSWNGFLALPAPVNVAPGDLVQVFVRTAGPSPILVEWVTVSAALGVTYYWAFDTITPAGTYYVTRTM